MLVSKEEKQLVQRLHRLKGQLDALVRMYEEDSAKDVDQLVNLTDAVISGLNKVKILLIKLDLIAKMEKVLNKSLSRMF